MTNDEGWFYLVCVTANVLAAWRSWRRHGVRTWPVAWLALAAAFAVFSGLAFCGDPPVVPQAMKAAIDSALSPASLSLGVFLILTVFYLGRKWFVRPAVAWIALNASLLFLGASLCDPYFVSTVAAPDNIPIVAMIYLLAFFTWLATAQAVENDQRIAAGEPPVEQEHDSKVFVWPDLDYSELIAMILVAVLLLAWSLTVPAPLEQPANPAVTPNPSKAPWYFLGVQELLFYADPWYAGMLVPCLIVLGLMAIPYLDRSSEGSGCYTIVRRRFAYLVFQFGFLQLWILLILIGTFLRGPNWSFYGLYEARDPQRLLPLENVNLSTLFWIDWLGRDLPQAPEAAGGIVRLGYALWRELAGVVLLAAYFLGLPMLIRRALPRDSRRRLGRARYVLMIVLLLLMFTLPLKMMLQWAWHVRYVVALPEWFFNF
jgi:hypothetical protein